MNAAFYDCSFEVVALGAGSVLELSLTALVCYGVAAFFDLLGDYAERMTQGGNEL